MRHWLVWTATFVALGATPLSGCDLLTPLEAPSAGTDAAPDASLDASTPRDASGLDASNTADASDASVGPDAPDSTAAPDAEADVDAGADQRMLVIEAQGTRAIVGSSFWVRAMATNSDGQVSDVTDMVTWNAEDDVAYVGPTGRVVIRAEGEHTISATFAGRTSTIEVEGIKDGFATVSAGKGHTCAHHTELETVCWGEGRGGQLGDTYTSSSRHPVRAELGDPTELLGVGDVHTCAASRRGDVHCWGETSQDQLGPMPILSGFSATPVVVPFSSLTPRRMRTGGSTTCLLDESGELYCWGSNSHGQLGLPATNATAPFPTVIQLPGTQGVRDLAMGSRHMCALNLAGALRCTGDDADRQILANNSTGGTLYGFVEVAPTRRFKDVTAGREHTCALDRIGVVQCWGSTDSDQIPGNPAPNGFPTTLDFPPGVTLDRLSTGDGDHTCGVTFEGDVYCWGNNERGQLGVDASSGTGPHLVPLDFPASQVVVGARHTCALSQLGQLACWGDNISGQLGVGLGNPGSVPTLVRERAATNISMSERATFLTACVGDSPELPVILPLDLSPVQQRILVQPIGSVEDPDGNELPRVGVFSSSADLAGFDASERVTGAVASNGDYIATTPSDGCGPSTQRHDFSLTTNLFGTAYLIPGTATRLFIGLDSANYESNTPGDPPPGIRYILNP